MIKLYWQKGSGREGVYLIDGVSELIMDIIDDKLGRNVTMELLYNISQTEELIHPFIKDRILIPFLVKQDMYCLVKEFDN